MKIRLTIFSLFIAAVSLAHSDFRASLNKENIYLGYVSGWTEYEINNKFKILLELTDILFSQTKMERIPVYFSFLHDYTKVDDEYVAIAYETFKYIDYSDKTENDFEGKGLVIKMRSKDLDIKKILNLIWASMHNIKFIQENQSLEFYTAKYHGEFSLMSIPKQKVLTLLNEDYEEVNSVLKSKIYRNLIPESKPRNIDYYFQNNQFNFYNTREPEWKYNSENRKNEISKSYGEVILTLDNVVEIAGDFSYGHFVFENDSTFYYLPQLKDKIFGPTIISGLDKYRRPILENDLEFIPFKRFSFRFEGYNERYREIMYIPDSNLIIPNYDKMEQEMVSNLIWKTDIRKEGIKNKEFNFWLLGLFLTSLIVNLILIIRKKKSS